VAPPGAVMLSESTARLVEGAAVLGDPELVRIKGADHPVCARRLVGVSKPRRVVVRAESNLVGRRWEMAAVEGLLERAVDGQGAVVGVAGSPGIGKSPRRWVFIGECHWRPGLAQVSMGWSGWLAPEI